MSKYKVLLLDVDGVLLRPPKLFSHSYAEERGLDKERFNRFFAKYAKEVSKGSTDYRKLIIEHNDVWEWDGTPDELLQKWFSYGLDKDEQLLKVVADARKIGVKVFLATDQDKYRAKFLFDLFAEILDGAYISSAIKHNKEEPEFFENVLADLQKQDQSLQAQEVIYFDDSEDNIFSAKKAGITALLYKNPSQVKNSISS